jgi:hypothetical protein
MAGDGGAIVLGPWWDGNPAARLPAIAQHGVNWVSLDKLPPIQSRYLFDGKPKLQTWNGIPIPHESSVEVLRTMIETPGLQAWAAVRLGGQGRPRRIESARGAYALNRSARSPCRGRGNRNAHFGTSGIRCGLPIAFTMSSALSCDRPLRPL